MQIDRSDPTDEPGDAIAVHRGESAPDNPGVASKGSGEVGDSDNLRDSSPTRPGLTSRAEQIAAHHALINAVCRQYGIDHEHARAEKPGCETAPPGMPRAEAEDPEELNDHLEVRGGKTEVGEWRRVDALQAPGGDVPDDPRNYSNPKTGRLDASWLAYDRAVAAAREHAGGDLGPDSVKMYDYHPATGEGTGTLIGEQTPDRLRGWRIDGQDGHVNWWDWTGGKKGAGGAQGHDWFPEDSSIPGSRYIGWAPWQDSDGNIIEGN